jgi:hypothetical protein
MFIIVLAVTATAEQKARLLELKAEENAETIEHLRHERSLLMAEHKKLQLRFKNASEVSGAHTLRAKRKKKARVLNTPTRAANGQA